MEKQDTYDIKNKKYCFVMIFGKKTYAIYLGKTPKGRIAVWPFYSRKIEKVQRRQILEIINS